jgi:hypothetical protein
MRIRTQSVIITTVAIIIFFGALLTYRYAHRPVITSTGQSNLEMVKKDQEPQVTDASPCGVYPVEACEEVKTYESSKLGVSFQVHKTAQVTELNNRIEVDGQYMEVFTKAASQDLATYVKENDGPIENCKLESVDRKPKLSTYKEGYYPDSFQTVVVHANAADWDRISSTPAQPMLCNAKLVSFNGLSFYLADANHPTKVARINIGQYSVPAGTKVDWQDTIRFK